MKILCACEESQAVCIAFRKNGHEAYSADILPCSGGHPEWHIQGDVLEILNNGWDMLIGFPPCTYLTYAAMLAWNRPGRAAKRGNAMIFFMQLYNAPIPKICIENPRGYPHEAFRKPDQVIHPYYFGDSAMKRTGLWLKNLPKLTYNLTPNLFETQVTACQKPEPVIQFRKKTGKRKLRYQFDVKKMDGYLRSKTFPGIAKAMADQWG